MQCTFSIEVEEGDEEEEDEVFFINGGISAACLQKGYLYLYIYRYTYTSIPSFGFFSLTFSCFYLFFSFLLFFDKLLKEFYMVMVPKYR